MYNYYYDYYYAFCFVLFCGFILFFFVFFLYIYDDSLILLVSDFELIDEHDCKSSSNEGKGFSLGRRRVVGGLSWYFWGESKDTCLEFDSVCVTVVLVGEVLILSNVPNSVYEWRESVNMAEPMGYLMYNRKMIYEVPSSRKMAINV